MFHKSRGITKQVSGLCSVLGSKHLALFKALFALSARNVFERFQNLCRVSRFRFIIVHRVDSFAILCPAYFLLFFCCCRLLSAFAFPPPWPSSKSRAGRPLSPRRSHRAPCYVLGYVEEEGVYEIVWKRSGAAKRVKRLNLLFDSEDQEAFRTRLQVATEHRDHMEAVLVRAHPVLMRQRERATKRVCRRRPAVESCTNMSEPSRQSFQSGQDWLWGY